MLSSQTERFTGPNCSSVYQRLTVTLCLLMTLLIGLVMFSDRAEAAFQDSIKAGQLRFKNKDGSSLNAIHQSSEVNILVSGIIAHVTVRQSFTNQTDDWQEAEYVFPLVETAAVNFMQMEIGNRLIKAEVKEKEQAKRIYKAAKKEGKKAALTEQSRANLFTQSVANIAPGETINVELHYVHSVQYDAGEFSLRFPMTLTPRYISGDPLTADLTQLEGARLPIDGSGWGIATNEVPDAGSITPTMVPASEEVDFNPISIKVTLNSGLPLKHVASLYHDVNIVKTSSGHKVSFAQDVVAMDRDYVLSWQPVVGSEPRAAVFRETIGAEDYILLMMVPPSNSGQITPLPKEMIFVIDTSGSMDGTSIAQAKSSLVRALQRLNPTDLFNVIEFNSQSRVMFDASQMADRTTVNDAVSWVSQLQSGGGTNMAEALVLAVDSPPSAGYLKHIVFLTDGAVGNESLLFGIIHQALGDARLFTVGIGSAPNSYFMRKSAEFGRGTFTHIGDLAEASTKMDALYKKLDNPIASNINISWPFNVESYPTKVPALYLDEPLLIMAKTQNIFGEVSIAGETARDPWQQILLLDGLPSQSGVGSLWARAKIESLEDQKITGRSVDEVRTEIIDVALTHGLVSNYTSLVAVEEFISRYPHERLKSAGVPNQVAAGQVSSLNYPRTATSASLSLLIGLISLMCAFALLVCRYRYERVG
jgi:Ca-activated chloride channel homolog